MLRHPQGTHCCQYVLLLAAAAAAAAQPLLLAAGYDPFFRQKSAALTKSLAAAADVAAAAAVLLQQQQSEVAAAGCGRQQQLSALFSPGSKERTLQLIQVWLVGSTQLRLMPPACFAQCFLLPCLLFCSVPVWQKVSQGPRRGPVAPC